MKDARIDGFRFGEWDIAPSRMGGYEATNGEVLGDCTYDTGFGATGDAPKVIYAKAGKDERLHAASDEMRELLDLRAMVNAMIEAQEEHDDQFVEG